MRAQATFALTAAALVLVLATAPAYAAREHSFVASYGNDGNVCSYLSPCATFQQALSVTVAGGEITAIDSDGFGPLNITQSVTITGAPGAEANVPAVTGGSSIVINGSGINVTVRNLTINGAGVGWNGIEIDQAGSVTVINCTIENFVGSGEGNGIFNGATTTPGANDLTVTNSLISNNSGSGIYISSSSTDTNALIGNDVITGNAESGILNYELFGTIAIANSLISGSSIGLDIEPYSGTISIEKTVITGNGTGIYANFFNTPEPKLLLGRSVITGNTQYGVSNQTTTHGLPNGFYSYDDNRINGNGTSTTDDEFGTALNIATYVKR
jgi:hypothetical protein